MAGPVSDEEVRRRLDRMYASGRKKRESARTVDDVDSFGRSRAAQAEKVSPQRSGIRGDVQRRRNAEARVRAESGMDWARAARGQSTDSNQ